MPCKRPIIAPFLFALMWCLCTGPTSGCVGGVVGGGPLLERLNGRGPVPLASDNPYLPANRLLEDEMKDSDAIREFVNRRGRPTAIGVMRGVFKKPEIQLYYPEQGEVYAFKRKGGDWLTLGPAEISSADREVLAVNRAPLGAVSLLETSDSPTNLEERIVAHLAREPGSAARASMRPLPQIRHAQLRRLSNGSYAHTVTFSGETLAVLADWYTGDPAQAARLLMTGRSGTTTPLRRGVTVTIPKALLRNKTPLPETALQ